ncbi:MAG: hypothetical protein U0903_10815 [Planctomycetales bacterium]
MTASRTVLGMIPGITTEQVEQIITARENATTGDPRGRQSISSLYTQGVFDLATIRRLAPYLTCSGDTYRAQIAGYSTDTKQVQRAELVIDASGPSPRRLYWKDLQLMGPGYSLSLLVGEGMLATNAVPAGTASSASPPATE